MHARLQNDLFVTTPTPSLLQENSWSLLPNPHGASPHKLWSGVGEIFIPYHTPNVSQPYIQSTTPPHPLPLMTPPPQGVSCDICNLYVPLTSFHCFRSIYLIDINLFSSSYRAQINKQDLIQTKFCVQRDAATVDQMILSRTFSGVLGEWNFSHFHFQTT